MYSSGISFTGVTAVSPAPPAPTVTTANNGVSLNGTTVVLGQNVGAVGNPAGLLSIRQIPVAGRAIRLTDTITSATDQMTFIASQLTIQASSATTGRPGITLTDTNANFSFRRETAGPGQYHDVTSGGTSQIEIIYHDNGAIQFTNQGGQYQFSDTTLGDSFVSINGGSAIAIQSDLANDGTSAQLSFVDGMSGQSFALTLDATNVITSLIADGGLAIQFGVFFGSASTVPLARIHIAAGTGTAGTAAILFDAGALLAAPPDGAVEFNGTNLFLTVSTVRYTVAKTLTATAALDFPNTLTLTSSDLTIALTGAASGDIVSLGVPAAAVNANSCYTAFVSAANVVTVRFNNYSALAIDPASGTFRVSITKY